MAKPILPYSLYETDIAGEGFKEE